MKAYSNWVEAKFYPKNPDKNSQYEGRFKRVRSVCFIPEDDEDEKLVSKFLGMITCYKKVKT